MQRSPDQKMFSSNAISKSPLDSLVTAILKKIQDELNNIQLIKNAPEIKELNAVLENKSENSPLNLLVDFINLVRAKSECTCDDEYVGMFFDIILEVFQFVEEPLKMCSQFINSSNGKPEDTSEAIELKIDSFVCTLCIPAIKNSLVFVDSFVSNTSETAVDGSASMTLYRQNKPFLNFLIDPKDYISLISKGIQVSAGASISGIKFCLTKSIIPELEKIIPKLEISSLFDADLDTDTVDTVDIQIDADSSDGEVEYFLSNYIPYKWPSSSSSPSLLFSPPPLSALLPALFPASSPSLCPQPSLPSYIPPLPSSTPSPSRSS